jgi:hypothetical protein
MNTATRRHKCVPRFLLLAGVVMTGVVSCSENQPKKIANNAAPMRMAFHGPVLGVDAVKRQLTIKDKYHGDLTFNVPSDDLIVVQSEDGERQRFSEGLKGIENGTNLWIEVNSYRSGEKGEKGGLQAVVFLPKNLQPK